MRCLGNVSYWILIKSTLGGLFSGLWHNTPAALATSSLGGWVVHFLIL